MIILKVIGITMNLDGDTPTGEILLHDRHHYVFAKVCVCNFQCLMYAFRLQSVMLKL